MRVWATRFAIVVSLIVLAGCNSSSAPVSNPMPVPAPAPVPQPAPAPAPPIVADRPKRVAFEANWAGPDLKAAFSINGDVPPLDTIPAASTAIFGVANDPSLTPLTQPGPNVLYSADGKLHFHAVGMGYGVISRQTFSRDGIISVQTEVTCTKLNDNGGWGGITCYNGDAVPLVGPSTQAEQEANMWKTGQWFGIYFSLRNGQLVASIWSASQDTDPGIPASYGVPYIFRMDYDHANKKWSFFIFDAASNALLYQRTIEGTYPDKLAFDNDPHFAPFLGGIELTFGPADVCVT